MKMRILIAFDENTLGMVLLAANPNERTRWNDTALALAESLTPMMCRASLKQTAACR